MAAMVLVGGCSPGRTVEALSVLRDIGSRDTDPALSIPGKIAVGYATADGPRRADLYVGKDVAAGLVLVPGAARLGKDDPRLIAFAHSLARARFAVLVPDIANLRALKVGPGDAREIAHAVRYLSNRVRQAGADADSRVGLAAISYSVGPAVLAALADDTRARLRFVLAIGGYYDLKAAIAYFTTGCFRESPSAPWRYRQPNAYGKWVFVLSNADRVSDPHDRRALKAMAERKLENLGADVDDLVSGLRAEGRAFYALITNTLPDKTPGLIAALPPAAGRDIDALNLRGRDFSRLRARLYLVHGRDDPIIPYTESVSLAGAVGPKKSRLFIVDSMGHTDAGSGGVSDTLTLWEAIYEVLEERDEMRAPEVPFASSR